MIGSAFKSFWHAMTSNDRHSNFDSPYRTGQHVPLDTEHRRMSALAAVATAGDSRHDVSNPYYSDDGLNSPMPRSAGFPTSPGVPAPYSPGSRSESARRHSHLNQDGFEVHSPTGEIPMQSFQDGLPPPPALSHSWRRIDNWAEENYPELFDQLCEGCTSNDLNELEHMLDCSLPMDVRDSLQIHDGQERGGMPTGIIFGCMLLDCEEMVQEWENWRKVNTEFLQQSAAAAAAAAERAKAADAAAASTSGSVDGEGSDEASSSKAPSTAAPAGRPMWRQELQAIQDCVPPNAVQKVYAHPAWIPLVRDWGGNNLAVDLAPGPTGTWGQVIMFGRDYDTKYVIARSWAAFIALVADDLASGKWFIDEETNELKLREFKTNRVEPSYFDILRWRADQKYGRRMNKRKSAAPSVVHSPTGSGSPYISPTDANEPRGRPLHRLSSPTPLVSPKPGYGKSPLARVTEEASASEPSTAPASAKSEKLVEVETPRVSGEGEVPGKSSSAAVSPVSSIGAASMSSKSKSTGEKVPIAVEAETMKTIEI